MSRFNKDDKRGQSENSQRNLRLGGKSRYQGKERHNFTILPVTYNWLHENGNASERIDELVRLVREKELVPLSQISEIEKIAELEAELKELRQELKKKNATTDKIIDMLKLALPLPANKGGAIKDVVRKVLSLLADIH